MAIPLRLAVSVRSLVLRILLPAQEFVIVMVVMLGMERFANFNFLVTLMAMETATEQAALYLTLQRYVLADNLSATQTAATPL